jgi:hypothetical protein
VLSLQLSILQIQFSLEVGFVRYFLGSLLDKGAPLEIRLASATDSVRQARGYFNAFAFNIWLCICEIKNKGFYIS